MPDWVFSLLVGVVVGLAIQYATAYFRFWQYRHEKLMEKYSEFIGFAADEFQRAFTLESGVVTGADDKHLAELDFQRHALRNEMYKRLMQIRLLERNKTIQAKAEELLKSQAFVYRIRSTGENYFENLDKMSEQRQRFEKLLSELVDQILCEHSAWRQASAPV